MYVQYVEMVVFQNEFQELVVRFRENEKIIQDIPVTGSDLAEVNAHLDSLENLMEVHISQSILLSFVLREKKIFLRGSPLMFTKPRDCPRPGSS